MTLQEIACALGGEVSERVLSALRSAGDGLTVSESGNQVRAPGPGHSPRDRSLERQAGPQCIWRIYRPHLLPRR
jgi:hypothetical protein